jgi:hypothetical protein
MSKPVLGRGLGELLQGQTVARPSGSATAAGEPRAALSPGFERLTQSRSDEQTARELAATRERLVFAQRALWMADAGLVAVASWFAFRPGAAPGAMDLLFCAAAIITGAVLGVIAFGLDADA